MYHLKRGLLNKVEQVCGWTKSDQVLNVAKFARLLAILKQNRAYTRKGMKQLRLPLIESRTVIQAARIPLLTCVLWCHMSYLKVKGKNLIGSDSVVGGQLPACRLANTKFYRFLKPGQLPTPARTKRLYLMFISGEMS